MPVCKGSNSYNIYIVKAVNGVHCCYLVIFNVERDRGERERKRGREREIEGRRER